MYNICAYPTNINLYTKFKEVFFLGYKDPKSKEAKIPIN